MSDIGRPTSLILMAKSFAEKSMRSSLVNQPSCFATPPFHLQESEAGNFWRALPFYSLGDGRHYAFVIGSVGFYWHSEHFAEFYDISRILAHIKHVATCLRCLRVFCNSLPILLSHLNAVHSDGDFKVI